jgi:Predicted nucleotidyltransferases
MKTKAEVLEILEKDLPYLKKVFHVEKIGLFGSYARQEQTEESDLDLMVEFQKTPDFLELSDLEDHLSDLVGFKVEIVTPGGLKNRVKQNIMEDMEFVSAKSL